MALLKSKDYQPEVDANGGVVAQDQIQFNGLAAAPTDADLAAGRLYYDTVLGGLYAYISGNWVCINTANTTNLTLGGAVTFSGAHTTTFTVGATTTLTLPATGTLATLAGAETLSSKTLTTPIANGLKVATTAKSATFTATAAQYFFPITTGSSADVVANLPASSGSGQVYIFKKVDAGTNHVVITPAGSDKIDGASTSTITAQYGTRAVIDGAAGYWSIISVI